MAPAVKKMKTDVGAVAVAEPDVNEMKHEEQNDNDNEGSDDEESPMSIIAQFQSEDVRAACLHEQYTTIRQWTLC